MRGERSNNIERWRSDYDLAALPTRKRIDRTNPLAGFELACVDQSLLARRHPREKEPRVEPPRREVRRYPSARGFEVRAHDFETVLFKSLLEALSFIPHRAPFRADALERQSLSASGEEHPGFLEELTHRAAPHDSFIAVTAHNRNRAVFFIELTAGEGMKSAHELKLQTSLDPE